MFEVQENMAKLGFQTRPEKEKSEQENDRKGFSRRPESQTFTIVAEQRNNQKAFPKRIESVPQIATENINAWEISCPDNRCSMAAF